MSNFLKKNWWFLLVMSFFVAVNLIWLNLDKTPPAWDQAAHLKSIVSVNQWLRGQFWGNATDLIRSFWGYPPLIYGIGGWWSLFMGVSVAKITFLNTLFLMGAITGVYKLAKEISKNNGTALLAAVVFLLFPVVGDISRNMLLDLPLLVWVVWGLYFWFKSNNLENKKYSWGLLIMLILASLTKLNGFMYFVPVIIILLIKSFKNVEIFLKLVIGGLIYGVAVGWWWVIDWQNIYQYLTGLAGSGEKLTDPINLGEWRTWIYYLKLFVLHQVSPIVALVVGIFSFWVPKKNENKDLIWWTAMVYIIFTLVKNKDFRFTLPLLIPAAIWMGWGLMEFGKKVSRSIFVLVLILILGWMGFNFIENGFGWPIKKPVTVSTPTFLFGDVDWIGFDNYPVRAVGEEIWPNEKIVIDLNRVIFDKSQLTNVLTLVNIEELNNNNLNFYAAAGKKNKIYFDPVSMDELSNKEEIVKVMDKYTYVLVSEKNYEATPFYTVNLNNYNKLRNFVWENVDKFEILEEYKLPNQKTIYLIKKN